MGRRFRRVVRNYKSRKYALWRCASRLEGGTSRCSEGATIRENALIEKLRNYWESELAEKTEHDFPENSGTFAWEMFIKKIEIWQDEVRIYVV